MAALIAVQLLKNSCLVLVISLCLLSSQTEAQNIVNCFYTNWAQYRPEPATFDVSDINPNLCSHLTFAFAKVEGNEIHPYEANDATPDGAYNQINGLKAVNPNLKTFLAVGGYTHGPEPFSAMAATKENRTEFIRNVMTYLRYWKFDGIDIDWEYVSVEDRLNYVYLAQEMMTAFEQEAAVFGRERLQLSLSVPAGKTIIDAGYDVEALNSTVDFFNVMAYDYHGPWENNTNIHTPLRSLDTLNVIYTMMYYGSLGASADKLLLGLAAYARTWTLEDPADYTVGANATGPGEAGNYTKAEGILSYYEVCERLASGYIEEALDPVGVVRHAHLDTQWITYETSLSLQKKTDFVLQRGFGGIAFWALDFDDFSGGSCGMGEYPLLTGVINSINGITTTTTTGAPTTPTTPTIPVETTTPMEVGTTTAEPMPQNIVNCYYTNWAQYRAEPATFEVSDIDPTLCDHLTFAFAQVVRNSIEAYEANDDISGGAYQQFNDLKNINPNLTTFLSVGGYTHGEAPFSAMAATQAGRTEFISSVINHLRYWDFDGLDIDWEFVSAADSANYVALVTEMMAAFEREATLFDKERLKLTLSVPAGIPIIQAGYDIAALNGNVDYFNVMAYDYHGQWENMTNLHTPLNSTDPDTLNVEDTLEYYVSAGASKTKLLMGLATYAHTWTLADPAQFGIGAEAIGAGMAGNYTQTEGILSYYEVCQLLASGYIEEPIDPVGLVWYAHLEDQWITYEKASSLRYKTEYVLDNGYGGVAYWTLDFDDFTGGSCGMGAYPLLNAVVDSMNGIPPPTTTEMTTQEVTTGTTMLATTAFDISNPNCPMSMELHPDPYNCDAYIMCIFNEVHRVFCSTGQIYNPSTEACESNSSYQCTIVPTTKATTTLPPNYPCLELNGSFPDKDSCNRYYYCMMGEPIGVACGAGQIFNPSAHTCEDEATSSYTCPV